MNLPVLVASGRSALAATVLTTLAVSSLALAPAQAAPTTRGVAPVLAGEVSPSRTGRPLTNLAHLNFLSTSVTPPAQAGHTTYRIGAEPGIGTLWTYANRNPDGSYTRIGGGDYDAATNTYSQGAFNSDDMARAAVVYLRHWRQTGSASSRRRAYELLRGVMYMQTVSGPNRGNLVLWMQPDGTLHAHLAINPDSPDPSDSDASYWLSRGIWALGEGYAAFRRSDPAFAAALRSRLDLAISALDREVLTRYGTYLQIDGRRTPAWLIADGADASSEAVLGLSAYVQAGGPARARTALARFSEGIADLSGGTARSWPFGAVLPWALSRSDWHAWASQTPAALAMASLALHRPSLARVAAKDSNVFDPWLLTSGGPDNGRLPTRIDGTQISYGIDSRVESLLSTAKATRSNGPRELAGLTAAWFFGANAAGVPAYDPATGRTVDGISPAGDVNYNAGAESTIHGLLAMLALDANPDIAAIAEGSGSMLRRVGDTTLEAEDASLSGAATAVAPTSLWTGESQYGGTGYVAVGNGGSVTFAVPSGGARLVMPVLNLEPGSTAVTTFRAGGVVLGTVRSSAVGPQGDSPAAGALLPVTLTRALPVVPAGSTVTITARTVSRHGDTATLDALMLEPRVSRLVIGGRGHGTALLRSGAGPLTTTSVAVPGSGAAVVASYDGGGHLVATSRRSGRVVTVEVVGGGYTIARR